MSRESEERRPIYVDAYRSTGSAFEALCPSLCPTSRVPRILHATADTLIRLTVRVIVWAVELED